VDSDLHCLSIGLLSGDTLDEDPELLPVATHHLALAIVVTSAEDHKKNMRKLEVVRKRREQAESRRKAEEETELAQDMQRAARFRPPEEDSDGDDDDAKKKKKKSSKSKEIPKLTKIEIKKMKPTQMKDALKERGLEIQGNKNALLARLLEYEGAR